MWRNSWALPVLALLTAGAAGLLLFLDFNLRSEAERTARAALKPATVDGQIEPNEYARHFHDAATGMALHWTVVAEKIYIGLRAPAKGWVAIGLGGAGSVQIMKDADILMGYVDETGLHLQDGFAHDFVAHASDKELGGQEDILASAGSERGGYTEIELVRKLDTGDPYDRPIVAGAQPVLLAHAEEDNFTALHTSRSTLMLDLLGGRR